MALRLLHLSDIHFRSNKIGESWDLDADLRNEIKLDLQEIVSKSQKIDVILIGGDIAFSGSCDEYVIAQDWLKEVCTVIDCKEENILMVPGNHDVDRKKLDAMILDVHTTFKSFRDRVFIDNKLANHLRDGSSQTLLKPLENYHAFAQRYGSIPNPNNLFWEKDFPLNGSTLRIRGLNSAIVSNEMDDAANSKLILGSVQTMLKREKGIIYLVLCHHPPDWLHDGEEAAADFNERARLHLFGHKHTFSQIKIGNSLRLSAGAVHPSRSERDWDPRYNVLELDVVWTDNKAYLEAKVWRRVWNKSAKKFRADFDDDGNQEVVERLLLSDIEIGAIQANSVASPTTTHSKDTIDVIHVEVTNPQRKLVYLFMSLPYHRKLRIAVDLELVEAADQSLNEIEKSQSYFKRAQQKGSLARMWSEVVKYYPDYEAQENPFKEEI